MRWLLLTAVAFTLGMEAVAHGQAVLRKGDVFDLKLSGMPAEAAAEWTLQYTVGDDGRVKIPYLGELTAGGTSAADLARKIEQRLMEERLFSRPTVLITLSPSSRFITIGGGVHTPQAMPWSPELSLSAAIKRAGGLDEFTGGKRIKISRDGKSWVVNLNRAAKDPAQNPKLLPGDEIDVQ